MNESHYQNREDKRLSKGRTDIVSEASVRRCSNVLEKDRRYVQRIVRRTEMSKQVWCQGCNQWYEAEMRISECPFCYTINYAGEESESKE